MPKEEKSSKVSLLERFVPVLILISFALAFLVGVLWQKVSSLEKGGVANTNTTNTGTGAQPVALDIETIKGLFDKNLVKFGDKNEKVLFVEIADPSCPYCHVANGQNPELAAQIGAQFKYVSDGGSYVPPVTEMRKLIDEGKAAYTFIYFPGHGNGEMATKALYCAYDSGKYWEAHDLLYSNKAYTFLNDTIKNDKTKSGELANFLKSAVNVNEMKKCLDSGKYDARLAEEQNLAGSLGVTGTPGFIINTERFDGAYSWTDMQSVVDNFLK